VALPSAAAAVPTAAAHAGPWSTILFTPLYLLRQLLLMLLLLLLLLLLLRAAALAVVAVMFHIQCIPFSNHGQCIAAVQNWLHPLV
jgi:hypothetical protein